MQEKITLSGVPETMLQTVYARARESSGRGAIRDPKAEELIGRLDYDFSPAEKDAPMRSGVIARTIVLDRLVGKWLAAHPGAVVVNIACGLDTRCYRMSGYAHWYDLDLPETMAVRERLLPAEGAISQIAMSAMEDWGGAIRELPGLVDCNKPFFRRLMHKAFLRAKKGCEQWHDYEMEVAPFDADMVLKLGIASVALTGSVLLIGGSIDILTLFLFLLVASRLYDPMQGALQNLAAVIAMRTNVGRMNEILEYPVQTGSETLTNQGCDIVFDHVGFAYNSGETVLRDVSFTAKQGEVTALVGPSGGGKTTVSRLAARFWDYQKGRITVGGMDVSRIDPEKLMSLYSIVFQDVTLFDNTILENIRLGRKDATDEEVLAAARLANCDEFAEKLPDKWNTDIGENGCALSGGERQRISIARAFLKDAPIILLDEATASLDVENETLIQTALSRLIRNKTVLIIAHRMRTVSGADQIVVLKDGAVAEQGSPAELLQKEGLFAHMVRLQTESQQWTLGKA